MVKILYKLEPSVDAVTALFLRMSMALPFFLIAYWNTPKKKLDSTLYLKVFLLGFLGYYLSSYLDFWGLEYISAGLERLILFVYPTIVIILSFLFLNKKISKLELLSLIITYTGIFLVFSAETVPKTKETFIGSFLIFICAITYAIYLIGSGELIPIFGSRLFTSIAMATACSIVCIHFLFLKGVNMLFNLSKEAFLLGFGMAIITTVIPTFLLSEGIKRVGSSTASIIGTVSPVTTIFLAWFFLNEEMSSIQWIGTLFVMFGVFLVGKRKKEI